MLVVGVLSIGLNGRAEFEKGVDGMGVEARAGVTAPEGTKRREEV